MNKPVDNENYKTGDSFMKDAFKYTGLFVIGLLTVILFYPFFHEIGHIITVMALDYKISTVQLLPLPCVICEMDMSNEFAMVIVGFGGILFPYLISLIFPKKYFWLWYFWLVISGTCLLSFAISIIGIVFYNLGKPINNEDITQIMVHSGENYIHYLVMLISLSALRIIQIINTKPIKRCLKEFNV